MDKLSKKIDFSNSGGTGNGPREDGQTASLLSLIMETNPIFDAYLLNYLANSYVGPLLKVVESRHGLTRPEWIVIFCLSQHQDLNAQQISDVTGRAKSSISHAIIMMEKKKLLQRLPDPIDGRRQVLQLTQSGKNAYEDLVTVFVKREQEMLNCLTTSEKQTLRTLMVKMAGNIETWIEVE